MGNEEKLKILIEAQNKSKAAFEEANRQLEGTNKKFSSLGDKMDKIAGKMKNVGKKMTVGLTLPIVAGAGVSIKAFSDLEETLSKTDVTFQENSAAVREWSESAIDSMGLAQQSALDAASMFGAMGVGMGQTREEAANMAMDITQLGADLASYNNISAEAAKTKLAGIYTGESEALKSLGVVMTQTNLERFAASKGITKNIKDMNQQEKVQLRYNFVMDATADAQGDFVRTSDSIANKSRKTKESMKQLSAEVGGKLEPIMQKLLEVGNKVLTWFSNLSEGQMKAVLIIAGFVAALGPAIMIIGHLITAIKGIGIALTFLGAHPIILVIMAVIAVIAAAAFLIIKNWDTLKRWFGTFWQFVQDLFKKGIDFIKKHWDKLLPIIMGPLGLLIVVVIKNFDKIKAAFMAVVNAIKSGANAVWSFVKTVFNGIKTVIVWQFTTARDIVMKILNGIKNFFTGFGSAIKGGLSGVGNLIKKPFTSAFDAIKNVWNSTVGKLSFTVPDWVPGIGGKGFSMPKLYAGARNFSGGPAMVGDVFGRGGEIVNVPQGSDVFSNRESKNILRGLAKGQAAGGGGVTMNFYGDVNNENAEASKAWWDSANRMTELAAQGVPTNG